MRLQQTNNTSLSVTHRCNAVSCMEVSPSINAMLPCFLEVPNRMVNRNEIENHTLTDIKTIQFICLFKWLKTTYHLFGLQCITSQNTVLFKKYDVAVTYDITFLTIAEETVVLPYVSSILGYALVHMPMCPVAMGSSSYCVLCGCYEYFHNVHNSYTRQNKRNYPSPQEWIKVMKTFITPTHNTIGGTLPHHRTRGCIDESLSQIWKYGRKHCSFISNFRVIWRWTMLVETCSVHTRVI
jgi:hypothetical protein